LARVPLISLEDLRQNKLSSGRLKDLADIEMLPKFRSEKKRRRIKSIRRKKRQNRRGG
jgi:hypothetical protein